MPIKQVTRYICDKCNETVSEGIAIVITVETHPDENATHLVIDEECAENMTVQSLLEMIGDVTGDSESLPYVHLHKVRVD